MSRAPRTLTAVALAALLGAGFSACDSGGSSKSARTTTTTTKPRKPRTTTTTSGSTSTTGAPTSSTTAPPVTSTTTTGGGGGAGCGAASAPIDAAVLGGDLGPVPVGSYSVTDCRISASVPIWAAVTLAPKPGQNVQRLTVVLQRLGSIWTVHSYAPGATGCDAPPPVPTELRLGC